MSTKEWVSEPKDGFGAYQECIYDWDSYTVNPNPAVIQFDQSAETTITQKVINDELGSRFSLEASIPAKVFDKIAIQWCRKRSLNKNKYKLEKLLSECNFRLSYRSDESTEVQDETLNDSEITQSIKERSEQPKKIEGDLEMDNIFSILTSAPLEAGYLQECSNELLQLRNAGRNLSQKYPILSNIDTEEQHAKALMMMEVLLGDYDNNLLLIDALSCSIARFEANDDFIE